MVRAMVLAALALIVQLPVSAQPVSVLHVKIVLVDTDRTSTPVPGHALLISDNPSTTPPRVVRTAVDGTTDVRLRPGNYTIESDRPVTFHGKAYQWTKTVDVLAGRDTVLELTAANADIVDTATTVATSGSRPLEADPAFLAPRWQDSIVALWTPTTHASGFVVDSRGLVATNQKVVGGAALVEVQITPAVKVAARVLVADSARDVAVLWIDPQVIASVKAIPLDCTHQTTLADQLEIFTIGVPLHQPKDMTSGTVADLVIAEGSDGGPVFTADGKLIGLTSTAASDDRRRGHTRVRNASEACEVVAAAEKKMTGSAPPSGAHLPIEPGWPVPEAAFKDAAEHRAGSLSPYLMASPTFDVAFITPAMIFGQRYQAEQISRRARQGPQGPQGPQGSRTTGAGPSTVPRLLDFGGWSEYVDDLPPVLLVRVTPKMVEGFWTSVARGAAYTQGAALPAFKRPKTAFVRLLAYCGDAEVRPIHPFMIANRISDKDTISEGLYVFDPGAFGPQCESVKLVLYSEKEPERGETQVVEPRIVQQIAQDFALYPAPTR